MSPSLLWLSILALRSLTPHIQAKGLGSGPRAGEFEYRVVRLTDDISLDFAAGERLVGIEVLGASRLFDKPDPPEIELADLVPRPASV